MKLEELKQMIDLFNDIRREVGKARMALSVRWCRAAEENLKQITVLLNDSQQSLTINKIQEALNNKLEEL